MYHVIEDEFMYVRANENDEFENLLSDLRSNGFRYYSVEPERRFQKKEKTEIIEHELYIKYGEGDFYEDVEEIIKSHNKTVTTYSEINLIAKYFVVFGDRRDGKYIDSPVIYTPKDIIGEFGTFEDAWEAYEDFCKNYDGRRPVTIFAEIYTLDIDEEDVLVCYDVYDTWLRKYDEIYAIVSAKVTHMAKDGNEIWCVLKNNMYEYRSCDKAQAAFDILKTVYEEEYPELSDSTKEIYKENFEVGLIDDFQDPFSALESIYDIVNVIPVLVKESYNRDENGVAKLVKKEIIDFVKKYDL
ncbi:MAG: hypothetical protein E7536_09395 [Ruminococcaceae bacterium]|nr:hypothetical protein [Oscillospiraceae bacterium]